MRDKKKPRDTQHVVLKSCDPQAACLLLSSFQGPFMGVCWIMSRQEELEKRVHTIHPVLELKVQFREVLPSQYFFSKTRNHDDS